MEQIKNSTTREAEERAELLAAGEREIEADSMILTFAKPYQFEGQTYNEVDLSGMEDTTGGDLSAVGKILTKKGIVAPVPEMTMEFSQYMAARVSRLPVEFFMGLPSREAIKLKNLVTGFLYGGAGED